MVIKIVLTANHNTPVFMQLKKRKIIAIIKVV